MEAAKHMKQWHALTIDEIKTILAAQPKAHNPNRLEEPEESRWYFIIVRQFINFLILVLMLAAVLSFFLGDMIDGLTILAIVIFNGLIGFSQEWKAESAIKNLKKMLAPVCRIIRNESEVEINAEELVPGDYVILKAGNAVPADIRLVKTTDIMTDEASLTGESAPVLKSINTLARETPLSDRNNMAYMGTHVVNGYGAGLVVATGMQSEFGRIAKLTGSIKKSKTPLQNELNKLGQQFGLAALIVSMIVIIIGVASGKNVITMLMTGLSLAVSAIPEGLPAVVTITLALGARAMARKKALLRRLEAAETLGAVSVICTDKTGTLTKNEMMVQEIWVSDNIITVTGAGYQPQGIFKKDQSVLDVKTDKTLLQLLETAGKCNHARIEKTGQEWKAVGSPDEAALVVLVEKAGLKIKNEINIIAEFPFNSDRKRMSVVEKTEDQEVVHVKGAPEVLLPLCSHIVINGEKQNLNEAYHDKLEMIYNNMAATGLRVLVLAKKELQPQTKITETEAEKDLIFLGFVGMIDPPRNEVPAAIQSAKNAGIKVIMITGDSPVTAQAIAKQIGLDARKAVTSHDLMKMDDHTLLKLLNEPVLFARIIPKDKFRIVKLLQKHGHITAMTGDGVNDAPALKQADIGIAMGIRGTDVAKNLSSIVLSDDNFATIISAVDEGRRQYDNIRKFVLYITSSNVGEVIAILINIIIGGPLILLPIQILWINLVTDSATAISLSAEKAEKHNMERPPRQINQPILNKFAYLILSLSGCYIALVACLLYYFYQSQSYSIANSVVFTVIVIMSNIHALNFRNLHGPVSDIGWFSNKWLLLSIFGMIGLQCLIINVPMFQSILHTVKLTFKEWVIIISASSTLFIFPEIYKWMKVKLSNIKN